MSGRLNSAWRSVMPFEAILHWFALQRKVEKFSYSKHPLYLDERRHIELSLCQPFESVTMSHSDAPLHFDASFHPCSDFWWQCFMTMLHDNATPKRIKKVRTKREASKTTISISPRQAMNMWQRHRALSGLQDMHSPLTVLSKNLHNKINSLTWKWF